MDKIAERQYCRWNFAEVPICFGALTYFFFFFSVPPCVFALTPRKPLFSGFSVLKPALLGGSLMIQWLRICLPVQGCLVAQSYPTLCNPMDCRLPGSSVHGILQARILEWIAIPFSRANTRDTSSAPSAGRSCMSQSNLARVPQLLSPCLEPVLRTHISDWSPHSLEPMLSNERSHRNETPKHRKEEEPTNKISVLKKTKLHFSKQSCLETKEREKHCPETSGKMMVLKKWISRTLFPWVITKGDCVGLIEVPLLLLNLPNLLSNSKRNILSLDPQRGVWGWGGEGRVSGNQWKTGGPQEMNQWNCNCFLESI